MTAPLVPADVDLQDFPYMPLDVRRLRDSDLAALESPEACWAAVILWSASWHQVPAASLPDDDRVLSNLAGYGRVVAEWQRVRDGALRGWVKCDDGRLYHPVVAEKALEAWDSKLRHSHGKLKERLRKSFGKDAVYPTFEEWISAGRPTAWEQSSAVPLEPCAGNPPETQESSAGNPPENALKGEGEGKGKVVNPLSEQASEVHQKPSREKLPIAAAGEDPIGGRAIELTAMLRKRGASLQASDPRVREWAANGVSDANALAALEKAQERRQEQSDPAPVNAGLLNAILGDATAPKARGSPERRKTLTEIRTETIAALTGRNKTHERTNERDITGEVVRIG